MNYCKTCALANTKILKCRLFGHDINPNEDFCSKHSTEIITCDICGREMVKSQSVIEVQNGDHIRVMCHDCNSHMNTCVMCKNSQSCAFEDDPSPIPKTIQKKVRQGPVVAVTEVINPERVNITCKAGCVCYDPELDCLRQYGTCGRCENI
jgi:ribosomal protein S27E